MIKSKIGKYIQLFLISIESEIKKFFRFYHEIERDIYLQLNTQLHNKHTYPDFQINDIMNELNEFEKLILEIIDLAEFININLTAIRKILKKFDKKFNLQSNPVALYYLRKKLSDSSSSLVYILQFKIIDESSALIEKLIKSLEDIYSTKKKKLIKIHGKHEVIQLLEEPLLKEMNLTMISGNFDLKEVDKLIVRKFQKIKEMNGKIDDTNNVIRTNSDFWRLNSIKDGYSIKNIEEYKDLMVEYIQEENILQNLIPQVELKSGFKKEKVNVTNISITLIHTFLYIMNCFIVQPTNSEFLRKINYNPFLTGVVLSMTPLAAMISSIFYLNLKNFGYKYTYSVSLSTFLLGNFFYSFADYTESIIVMILGRILIGLGGLSVVNRRYIIEEVPDHLVQNYSLWYNMMLLIGMAAGPGAALFLQFVPEFTIGKVNVNIFTNPAIFCIILWIIFSIFFIFLFEEVQNQKNSYKISDADIINSLLLSNKECDSLKHYEEICKINDNYTPINMVYKDIQILIREEETTFSYTSVSLKLLGFILFIIKVRIDYKLI